MGMSSISHALASPWSVTHLGHLRYLPKGGIVGGVGTSVGTRGGVQVGEYKWGSTSMSTRWEDCDRIHIVEDCDRIHIHTTSHNPSTTIPPHPPTPHALLPHTPHIHSTPPTHTYQLVRHTHTGTTHPETTDGICHSWCNWDWGFSHSGPNCTDLHTNDQRGPFLRHWVSSSCCLRISDTHQGWWFPCLQHPVWEDGVFCVGGVLLGGVFSKTGVYCVCMGRGLCVCHERGGDEG